MSDTNNTSKTLFKVRLKLGYKNDHTQVGGYPDIYVYANSDNYGEMHNLVYKNLDKLTDVIPKDKQFRGILSIVSVGLPLIIEDENTKDLLGNIIPKTCLSLLYLCDFDGKKLTIINSRMYKDEHSGLEAYANIPNPPSQLISGSTHEKFLEEHKAFANRMNTEQFVEMLNETI